MRNNTYLIAGVSSMVTFILGLSMNLSLIFSFIIAIIVFIVMIILFSNPVIEMIKESDKRQADKRERQRKEKEHLDWIEKEEIARERGRMKGREHGREEVQRHKENIQFQKDYGFGGTKSLVEDLWFGKSKKKRKRR